MSGPLERHRVLVGSATAVTGLVLAVVWLVVRPGEAVGATGVRAVLLRYGHSVCWGLLSVAGAAYALRASRAVVSTAMWAALACYAAFVAALVL